MINKEAITLLKKALKKGKDNLPNTWEINQALALIKEQPPVGEFREIVEIRLPASLPGSYEGMKSLCATLTDTANEACDRLDASESSRKELVTALESFPHKLESQTHEQFYNCCMSWVRTNGQTVIIKANK